MRQLVHARLRTEKMPTSCVRSPVPSLPCSMMTMSKPTAVMVAILILGAPALADEPSLAALLDRGFVPFYGLRNVIIDQCSQGFPVVLNDDLDFECQGLANVFYTGQALVLVAPPPALNHTRAYLCMPRHVGCLKGEVVNR